MRILIICSKIFYSKIPQIRKTLEYNGHEVSLPNSYDNIYAESDSWKEGYLAHSYFKKQMFQSSKLKIENCDAVLTLNFSKGNLKNYVGGATFIEMYEAYMNNKKIYMMNDIPKGILYDEICGFNPIIIHNDFSLINGN